MACHAFRRGSACCGREIVEGGHQCSSLAFGYYIVSKIRQPKLESYDLLPLITSFKKGDLMEKVK